MRAGHARGQTACYCRLKLARGPCARAGLIVRERNWMEVFPWARWGGNDNLPPFQPGDTFTPDELLLREASACSLPFVVRQLWHL